MELTLADPKYLRDTISIISELVSEGTFKISPEAIELVAMDPANVAMIVFKLFSTTFAEYNVKKPVELSINLSNLKQILKRAKPTDMLSLALEENKLKVQLKGGSIRTFFLPIIELDEKEQKIPELEFAAVVTTSSSTLSESVEDVDIVAESVSFLAEPKKLTIKAEGDLSQANIVIDEDSDTKIKAKEKVKSKYSIEYLKKIVASSKLSDNVTLSFANDYPLKIDYISLDKLQLSFILAPRVDNE